MEQGDRASGPLPGGGWIRAIGLAAVVFGVSVFTPTVLIAVPVLLLLVGVASWGARRGPSGLVLGVGFLAALAVAAGPRDGIWYVERAWALLAGGCFVAASLVRPTWPVSERALAAVGGATAVTASVLVAFGPEAWPSIDWVVGSSVSAGIAAALDSLALVGDGRLVTPAFAAALYEWADRQILIFPALVAIASVAALCLAWWIVVRAVYGSGEGIGPLGAYRFNDHLIWLMIAGLVLVLVRWTEASTRVGWNAAAFMSALYAVRGAAVVTAISGGLSVVGSALLLALFLFAAPVVLGVAVLIGIGDMWLDFRARAEDPTV